MASAFSRASWDPAGALGKAAILRQLEIPNNRHRENSLSSNVRRWVIEGAPARNLHASLLEVWVYRDTVLAFAERDVRVKYKQAVLGIAWAVIQPLTFMAVFTLTLGRLANVQGDG